VPEAAVLKAAVLGRRDMLPGELLTHQMKRKRNRSIVQNQDKTGGK
jgi:hypothetical protein